MGDAQRFEVECDVSCWRNRLIMRESRSGILLHAGVTDLRGGVGRVNFVRVPAP